MLILDFKASTKTHVPSSIVRYGLKHEAFEEQMRIVMLMLLDCVGAWMMEVDVGHIEE